MWEWCKISGCREERRRNWIEQGGDFTGTFFNPIKFLVEFPL